MKVGDKVTFVTYAGEAVVTASFPHGIYTVKYDGDEYIAFADELALITDETPPEPYILIPVGEYDGSDLPDTEIDEHYTVWSVLPNPEAECTIIGE